MRNDDTNVFGYLLAEHYIDTTCAIFIYLLFHIKTLIIFRFVRKLADEKLNERLFSYTKRTLSLIKVKQRSRKSLGIMPLVQSLGESDIRY